MMPFPILLVNVFVNQFVFHKISGHLSEFSIEFKWYFPALLSKRRRFSIKNVTRSNVLLNRLHADELTK